VAQAPVGTCVQAACAPQENARGVSATGASAVRQEKPVKGGHDVRVDNGETL